MVAPSSGNWRCIKTSTTLLELLTTSSRSIYISSQKRQGIAASSFILILITNVVMGKNENYLRASGSLISTITVKHTITSSVFIKPSQNQDLSVSFTLDLNQHHSCASSILFPEIFSFVSLLLFILHRL